MEPMLCSPLCSIQIRSRRGLSMPEKKKTAAAAPAVEAPAAEAKESKTRKSAKAPARRGRPPLAPELYVEFSGKHGLLIAHRFKGRIIVPGFATLRKRIVKIRAEVLNFLFEHNDSCFGVGSVNG